MRVQAVASAEQAVSSLKQGYAGVVVTDMRLPGADGMALIRHCQSMDAPLPVIMITGHGDMGLAVEAMRSGAYDFIPKPFSPETLTDVVRRALEKRSLTLEIDALRQALDDRDNIEKPTDRSVSPDGARTAAGVRSGPFAGRCAGPGRDRHR